MSRHDHGHPAGSGASPDPPEVHAHDAPPQGGHPAHGGHPAGGEVPEEPGYPLHPELAPEAEPGGTHPHAGAAPAAHEHAPAAHEHAAGAHDRHAGHSAAMFRRKFWVSALLSLPVLAYSPDLQRWLHFTAPRFPGSSLVPFVLGIVIYAYGGLVFLKGAVPELRERRPGMMTLISLAITVAFVYSIAATFGLVGTPLWIELVTLIDVMLLGHWMEMRSIGRAQGALQELAKLLPDMAELVTPTGTVQVPVARLRPGDVVLVRPGASVPADGVVVEGRSTVDESLITGESRPVPKEEGDDVIGGTVNGSGALRVRITRVGAESALGGIMRLVEQAQTSRSRAQDLADRAAFWLTLVAIGAGTITVIAWLLAGAGLPFAIERLVTVLVIACPHALGLAIPLVIAISTTLAARAGLLVRKRSALERARELDVVAFDKTGTLTHGDYGVAGIATVAGMGEDDALRLAASAEADSEHVVARAIVAEAARRGLALPRAEAFEAIPGVGVRARVQGRHVLVGRPALLDEAGEAAPPELLRAAEQAAARGETIVVLVLDGRPAAAFTLADTVRPESHEAVERLKQLGIRVAMITGDSEAVARAVAEELGIDYVFARVLPGEKARKIEELKAGGDRVAMVGDGVNDAPALLTADIGIAIGAGTDVAIESGDIVLVRNDPRDVVQVIDLSRASYRKMVQNLAWATGYNVLAIPLAAGAFAWAGLVLPPAVGALLMSTSTVIVAVNAQLLRRRRP
ncbi:MAG TPA: heavy metal translocating P-type ATPase [Longimicrobiales bacterium]|nr:heavy metal translocating P-type ATPase [Longimicrobiales bacterium]